tara:strand:+ start:686 stop:1945 length:1260 start_codon:yes stop_codon:yes gene_type:complete
MNRLIKYQYIKKTIMILFLIGVKSTIFAASFKAPETLVNVPFATKYNTGDLEFSISTGLNSLKTYQFDLGINYALNENFKGGIKLINYNKAVLNCQATFLDIEKLGNLKVTGGVLNISSDPSLSTWDNERSVNSNNLLHFIVGSRNLLFGRVHFGIGKRWKSNNSAIINGYLLGFNMRIKETVFMMDFDGSAANIGMQKMSNTQNVIIKGALSFPIIEDDATDTTNLISIQLTRRVNIFKRYSKSLKDLEEQYGNFKNLEEDFENMKKDLEKDIDELRKSKELLAMEVEKLQSRDLGEIDPETGEEISEEAEIVQGYSKDIQALMYYQAAEDFFKKEEYYKAIQQLELGINLSPKEQKFYFVLGSIYYKLKNEKKAIKSWAEAYKIDSTSPDFNKMPASIKKKILKEIKRQQIKKNNKN